MIENLVKPAIKSFKPYKANQIACDIKLDANESPFGLSLKVKEELRSLIENDDIIRLYPDTDSLCLRQLIAAKQHVDPENVLVGTGSDELIHLIIDTFVDKGDVVVAPDPSFAMYSLTSKVAQANFVTFPVKKEDMYAYHVDEIIKLCLEEEAKLLFLCTPNNPPGNTLSNEDIKKIIKALPNTLVVIDEAYAEFSSTSFIDEVINYECAILLRTFSKAYGLAGLRCGYSIANKKVSAILKSVLAPYNLSQMTQEIARVVLLDTDENIKRVEMIKNERNRVIDALKDYNKIKVFPSEANYYLVEVENGIDLYEEMIKRNILIRTYKQAKNLENCFRITIGSPAQNDAVLEAISDIFS